MGGACVKNAVGLDDGGGGGDGEGSLNKFFKGETSEAKAAWGALGGAILAGGAIGKLASSCITEGNVEEGIHRYSYSSGTMQACPGTRKGFTGWYWSLQIDGKVRGGICELLLCIALPPSLPHGSSCPILPPVLAPSPSHPHPPPFPSPVLPHLLEEAGRHHLVTH